MSDQKMKPSSLAVVAVWIPGILILALFYVLFFSDMDKYATVAWRHSPAFRLRVLGFVTGSVLVNVVGFIGIKRWVELRIGQNAMDLKKANLELQVRD